MYKIPILLLTANPRFQALLLMLALGNVEVPQKSKWPNSPQDFDDM